MKTYYQPNIAIWFDLHDTLVQSKSTWLKAMRQYCKQNKLDCFYSLKKAYLQHGDKPKICKEYQLPYEEIRSIYLKQIKTNHQVVKLLRHVSKQFPVFLVTNALSKNASRELAATNITVTKVYGRDVGVKPCPNYIGQILEQNNLNFAIMIGNEKANDTFANKNVKTILVHQLMPYFWLKFKFNRAIAQLKTKGENL